MASISRGKTIRYSKDTSIGDLIESVIRDYPAECCVNLRPNGNFEILNSSIPPGEILPMKVHEAYRIKVNDKYVPDFCRLKTTGDTVEETYEEFCCNGGVIENWVEHIEKIANGKITQFAYGINQEACDYIEGLEFKGVVDIRKYGGVLSDYWRDGETDVERNLGIAIPSRYTGHAGDVFTYHVEDCLFSSVNTLLKGKKAWILPARRVDAIRSFEVLRHLAEDECKSPYCKKSYLPTIQTLLACGIDLKYIIQEEGDTVLTLPLGPHFGISITNTIAIARNCADQKDWVAVAMHYGTLDKHCPAMKVRLETEDKLKPVRKKKKLTAAEEEAIRKKKEAFRKKDIAFEETNKTCQVYDHLTSFDVKDIISYVFSPSVLDKYERKEKHFPILWSQNLVSKPPKRSEVRVEFVCEECRYNFKTLDALKNHQKKPFCRTFREDSWI